MDIVSMRPRSAGTPRMGSDDWLLAFVRNAQLCDVVKGALTEVLNPA
jgi:hypothetical protein